jgi:hypothetical protein
MKCVDRMPLLNAVIIALGLVVLLSVVSHAEEAGGRFTLAHPVHWGQAILPAGDYRFSIPGSSPTVVLILENITRKQGFLVVAQGSNADSSETSRLIIQLQGDERFVSAMYVPAIGQVLYFNSPHVLSTGSQAANDLKDNAISSPAMR